MAIIHHKYSEQLTRVAAELINIIRNGSHWEKVAAAAAIGRLRWHAGAAIPALIDLINEDADAKTVAVEAIGFIGPPFADAAIPALSRILLDTSDRDLGIASNAAHALGRTRHPDAVKPLLATLSDSSTDFDTSVAAANALAALGAAARDAVPFLADGLSLANPIVGNYIDAIDRIGVVTPESAQRLHDFLRQLPNDHELRPVMEEVVRKADI